MKCQIGDSGPRHSPTQKAWPLVDAKISVSEQFGFSSLTQVLVVNIALPDAVRPHSDQAAVRFESRCVIAICRDCKPLRARKRYKKWHIKQGLAPLQGE